MSSNTAQIIEAQYDYTDRNSRELFGMTALKNNHKAIKRLRKELGHPTHHGNKVWKSCLVLMDYLQEFPPKKRATVMDVGCGWGMAGLFCAKEFNSKVISVDIDEGVFPYLQLHAGLNGVKVKTKRNSYQKITGKQLEDVDLVIGADICFWDEMTKPLTNLAKRAQKSKTRMIVTDPGRPPFMDMAKYCEKKLGATLDYWSVAEPYNCSGYVLDIPKSK